MSLNAGFRSLVIVNPASAAGVTGRRWDRIASLLQASLGHFEHVVTRAPCEATELARAGLRDGFEMIVSVGGDGTLNEVVNGFFDGRTPVKPDAVLGVIAVGTGSDFGRSIRQTDLGSACARLGGRKAHSIDVGFARYTGHDGAAASRIFINVLSFGVSGLVARLVNSRLKALSGHAAFTLATLRALMLYRDRTITLEADSMPPQRMTVTNCAFGNGRFFGAGMQVAPAAQLDDGEFDATIWCGFTLMDFICKRHMLADGSHLGLPGARALRLRRATATSESCVLLEIDGESVGMLPVELEVLPGAIQLKV
jgi:YegS/Rv2252/BmrU family lipid kinase